ncbi:MAG: hypothetical protein JST66_13860, partial [Bacteroidetes bacterium]|nr:hypothetical protein [Bacteroidota bacterium]
MPRSSVRSQIGRLILLCLFLSPLRSAAQSALRDDPSDSSPSLACTTTAGTTSPLSNTGTGCAASGTVNTSSPADFTLAGSTSTSAALVPPPACGNFMDSPPNAPSPANDVWFRLDPPAAATCYRFTLLGSTANTPTLSNGAMAIYEAPSAAGPFRLIECAVGGAGMSASMPSVEANSYTPGNKLYLRVWDEALRTSGAYFTLCVQGQTLASMAARGAEETPCAASSITASSSYTNIDYVFAQEESPWLQTDSAYVGGDLWRKLIVPASGNVNMFLARATTGSMTAWTIGVSVY